MYDLRADDCNSTNQSYSSGHVNEMKRAVRLAINKSIYKCFEYGLWHEDIGYYIRKRFMTICASTFMQIFVLYEASSESRVPRW